MNTSNAIIVRKRKYVGIEISDSFYEKSAIRINDDNYNNLLSYIATKIL